MVFSRARFGTPHHGSLCIWCASGQQLRRPRHQSLPRPPPLCPAQVKGPIGPQQALAAQRCSASSLPYSHYMSLLSQCWWVGATYSDHAGINLVTMAPSHHPQRGGDQILCEVWHFFTFALKNLCTVVPDERASSQAGRCTEFHKKAAKDREETWRNITKTKDMALNFRQWFTHKVSKNWQFPEWSHW